jgi:hypothetical protein
MNNEIKAMVQGVRDYLAVPGQWCKHNQHQISDDGVVQYCIAGAASAFVSGDLGDRIFTYRGTQGYVDLAVVLGFTSAWEMADWNNDSDQETVVARLDELLAKAA